jgi:hypothetical protein
MCTAGRAVRFSWQGVIPSLFSACMRPSQTSRPRCHAPMPPCLSRRVDVSLFYLMMGTVRGAGYSAALDGLPFIHQSSGHSPYVHGRQLASLASRRVRTFSVLNDVSAAAFFLSLLFMMIYSPAKLLLPSRCHHSIINSIISMVRWIERRFDDDWTCRRLHMCRHVNSALEPAFCLPTYCPANSSTDPHSLA